MGREVDAEISTDVNNPTIMSLCIQKKKGVCCTIYHKISNVDDMKSITLYLLLNNI